MAQKKDETNKDETNENTATINFRCSPEMKRAVEVFALAGRFASPTEFLKAILRREIEHNRQLLDNINRERYDMNSTPVFNLPKPKRTGKKKQAAPMNETNETNGGDVS